jgi:hypothetical protein
VRRLQEGLLWPQVVDVVGEEAAQQAHHAGSHVQHAAEEEG